MSQSQFSTKQSAIAPDQCSCFKSSIAASSRRGCAKQARVSARTCQKLKQQAANCPDVNLLIKRSCLHLGSFPQGRNLASGNAASVVIFPKRKELRFCGKGSWSGCRSMCSWTPIAVCVLEYLQHKAKLHASGVMMLLMMIVTKVMECFPARQKLGPSKASLVPPEQPV